MGKTIASKEMFFWWVDFIILVMCKHDVIDSRMIDTQINVNLIIYVTEKNFHMRCFFAIIVSTIAIEGWDWELEKVIFNLNY